MKAAFNQNRNRCCHRRLAFGRMVVEAVVGQTTMWLALGRNCYGCRSAGNVSNGSEETAVNWGTERMTARHRHDH